MDKGTFLRTQLVQQFASLNPDAVPHFGKMNVHQMIEHMSDAFRQASGLAPFDPVGDEETTEKMYRFMMSDKPFRENTPNPYLPDTPNAPVHATTHIALEHLTKAIDHFFQVYEAQPDLRILNPFFGNLNYDEWVHLLYKHSMHHLRQFGATL
jgi:hypothetical protein